MANIDPQTEAYLKEFLEQQRLQAAKGYTLEKLAGAFLAHKQEDSIWKKNLEETLESHRARMNRHARRVDTIEKGRIVRRSPEDTHHDINVDELDERKWWRRLWKEKAASVAISVLLVLLGAGAVAVVQQIARPPQAAAHP